MRWVILGDYGVVKLVRWVVVVMVVVKVVVIVVLVSTPLFNSHNLPSFYISKSPAP